MITAGSTAQQHLPGAERHADRPLKSLFRATDRGAAPAERAIAFGHFRLLPARRLLLAGDEPVRLGSRALEILIALLERSGELVSKDELMARVWPSTFVEEGNLKVQVAGLRRALGDRRGSNRFLATVPGRGYRFVAPVVFSEVLPTLASGVERSPSLPAPVARMIGRADTVREFAAQLPHQRFMTIVGPGGIGKTTVALAVARELISSSQLDVEFVDLAPLVEPHLVTGALAAALGPEIVSGNQIDDVIAASRSKRMLLVLDNCEHVIEAAAALAVAVQSRAPEVQILATSREPLRAAGEQVYRLPALTCPPTSAPLTAAEALRFPAVGLFVQRTAATLGRYELDDQDAPIVADICRKLDGLPMAIEFAAARVDAFGLRELAVHLPDRLQLLTNGRRPTLPRHHSLRAALDWSHELLPEPERVVLRRLAVFAGGFTLEAASVVAASGEIAVADVVACVAGLVTKSLVAADVEGPAPCYRLLGTTRAYALEKLTDSGEREQVERRHAEHLRDQRTESGWHSPPANDQLAGCLSRIDRLRHDWASSL
jgi:predicted ATPase/DNA-binding winged helix-turn-helix (wHTH) protein